MFKCNKPTLAKLLKSDGRAVMVAMDHCREGGVRAGLEDQPAKIQAVIDGGADAIMTSYGVIKQYGHLMQGRVGMILRLDTGATKYREAWDEYTEWYRPFSVEDALRIGADGVIVNGFFGSKVDATTLRIMGETASEADRLGVPCMFEVHPCPCPRIDDVFKAEFVQSACRIGAEWGADLLKTYYTGDAKSFKTVTSTCSVPVLIAGGDKTDGAEGFLEIMRGVIDGGGAGCVAGRNLWGHPDTVAITRAVVAIVHENASVAEAMKVFEATRKR